MEGLNTKELDKLSRILEGKLPIAVVGILGEHNARAGQGAKTNAEIGAKHEFGLDGLPVRSFLRQPIAENMQKYLDKANLKQARIIELCLKTLSLLPLVAKLGIFGETIVSDAFASGGFGKWKPSNMAFKTNPQTLVETHQLRDSITSDIR